MLSPSSLLKMDLFCANQNKETSFTEDSLLIWSQNIPRLVIYVHVIQMSDR